jgi:hypothetical protein
MTTRSTQAAATRAAQAALTRPQDFDRYLLIDDTSDDLTEILTLLCERSARGLEVLS